MTKVRPVQRILNPNRSMTDFNKEYATAEGNYFSIYRPYFAMLEGNPSSQLLAIVFAELYNVGSMDYRGDEKRHVRNGGWFICSTKRLMRTFRTSDKTQSIWIRRLAEIGLIETRQKGIPARRWIRINFELREQMLAKVKVLPLETPELEEEIDEEYGTRPVRFDGTVGVKFDGTRGPKFDGTNNKEPLIKEPKKKKTLSGVCDFSSSPSKNGSTKSTKMEITDFDRKATKYFIKTLEDAGKPLPNNVGKWPDEMRKLRQQKNVGEEKIKEALHWYRKNIDAHQYVPQIYSLNTLRTKFPNLLDAMKRGEKQVINGYQLLTAQDVAKAQERDSEFCLNDDRPWVEYAFDFDAYDAADELTQRKMIADHVNRFIREGWDIADDLRHVGLGYLVKKPS